MWNSTLRRVLPTCCGEVVEGRAERGTMEWWSGGVVEEGGPQKTNRNHEALLPGTGTTTTGIKMAGVEEGQIAKRLRPWGGLATTRPAEPGQLLA